MTWKYTPKPEYQLIAIYQDESGNYIEVPIRLNCKVIKSQKKISELANKFEQLLQESPSFVRIKTEKIISPVKRQNSSGGWCEC
ncbi:hypothetical protein F1737_04355 [Methanoplanus sp. FWC-SCC4]|uniref:Uncharacterized protein n=1 Tax=Methanochimaera problematica TaxID=2609417 RepID=A0AA97FBU4_9EURY|nr:hypothetical protein [Methanoplanus sp. FWC-SCC4]WOF15987.1 hypothetical protein F1737_04355 [Methanoplanus sp. FWC-SCC4]